MIDNLDFVAKECRIRGVSSEQLSPSDAAAIYAEVQREDNNMDVVRLEKAPKIAVYVPPTFSAVGRCRDAGTGIRGGSLR